MTSDNHSYHALIQEIKSKVDLVDLIGDHVTLKKSGKYFKANCPFHQEKTPSFVVSPEIQRWHCFGACHVGGDIISFLMKLENISFGEALEVLAEKAGVSLPNFKGRVGFVDESSEVRGRIIEANLASAKYYHYLLKAHESAKQARNYLVDRGLQDWVIDKFQIGYAPDSWTNLTDYLVKRGYTKDDILLAGLATKSSRGSLIDRFRGRLMFPIQNALGKVVGFSGRVINTSNPTDSGHIAKYINTAETPIYHKRESLYGFFHSKDAIKKNDTAIVVEGEFDFLTPFSIGVQNVVAIKGSAFTQEQLKILHRYCSRLILALDNDKAGRDALKKSIVEATAHGFDLYVCDLPDGKDPDASARIDVLGFKRAIEKPMPIFDWLFRLLSTDLAIDDVYAKKKFVEEMAVFLVLIDNPVITSHYISKIASRVSSTKEAVEEVLQKKRRQKTMSFTDSSQSIQSTDSSEMLEKKTISGLLGDGRTKHTSLTFALLSGDEFENPNLRSIYLDLKINTEKSAVTNIRDFVLHLPSELRSIAEELYLTASIGFGDQKGNIQSDIQTSKEVYRLALNLKKQSAYKQFRKSESDEQLAHASEAIKFVEKELQML
jgi:DNA primase